MQKDSITSALQQGAPITCATCVHYHTGNGFCGKTGCGGPGSGRDFPCYSGPIPREQFVNRCLVCGGNETKYLIAGLETKFSLCADHKSVFDHVGQPTPDSLLRPVVVIEKS